MNHYYKNHNEVVIGETVLLHNFKGSVFWWKIDRKKRVILDEETGILYQIPEDMDLT